MCTSVDLPAPFGPRSPNIPREMVSETSRTARLPSSFGHHGGDGTMAVAFPAADAIVIFLTHSRGGAHLYALMETLGMLEVFGHPGSSFVWAGDGPPAAPGPIPAEQAQYVGSYLGTLHVFDTDNWAARVWQEDGRLHLWSGYPGERAGFWRWHLVPLGDHRFVPGRYDGSELEAIHPVWRVRFSVEGDRATAIQVVSGNDPLFSAQRADLDRWREDV